MAPSPVKGLSVYMLQVLHARVLQVPTTCWMSCFGLWTALLRGDLQRHKNPPKIQPLDTLSFPEDQTDGAIE